MADLKPSVRATYDSRDTGPRYWVTTTIDGKPLSLRAPIEDPFVRLTVTYGWRDLLRHVLRPRNLVVEVTVGADREMMHDVLELDENTLIADRTRKAAFQQSISGNLPRVS